jgi:ferrous iron transport protein B
MNCGAKLPVFGMLIAAFFHKSQAKMLFIFTLLSWAFALFAAKILRSTVLRGPKTPFVMELPPYRVPTGKGLLIHTWERTWQYIKKAGTIILGVSIIIWAMMTFPGLSEDRKQLYEDQRTELRKSFLSSTDVRTTIKNEKDLMTLDDLFILYGKGIDKKGSNLESIEDSPFFPLIQLVYSKQVLREGSTAEKNMASAVAEAYLDYKEEMADIDRREQGTSLERTVAGRIGLSLEGVTRTIGFDYRTNIALVGGFAAKEVIVSTLGTAYSLGEVDPENTVALSERLRKDPKWNPLVAFTMVLFTILYVPCFVTVISIKRESSWKWAGFSILFNLVAAYLVCLVVYQTGLALGLGV